MVLQTDPGLPTMVNLGGCHWRSLLGISEFFTGKELSLNQLNEAFEWAKSDPKVMSHDCTMHEDLCKLINKGFRLLGFEKPSAQQIGIIYPGTMFEFWRSTGVYTILKGLLHKSGYKGRPRPTYHFRLGDRKGKLLFDPSPGLTIIQEDSILLYMIDS